MGGDGPAAHVAGEEEQRPPGGLAHEAGRGGHERGDDVDGLGDVGHADVAALAHEDVEPDGDGQRVGERVRLLGALVARRALGVPDVPLVEAELGRRAGEGLAGDAGAGAGALDAGELDEGGGDADGALGGQGRGHVAHVRGPRGRVHVDAVHVDEGRAGLQHGVVPGGGAVLAAEHEHERGVEQAQRLGPLRGLPGVVGRRHLLDLPGAPDLVAQRPVLDGVGLGVSVGAAQVRVVRVARAVAVLDPL